MNDGRLLTTDVSANFTKSRDTKTRTNIKNPVQSIWYCAVV